MDDWFEGRGDNQHMIIDEALKAHGRTRFDINRIKKGTVASVLIEAHEFATESLKNLAKKNHELPKIHFGLVDDGSLNAGAFMYENEYFIFVNTGALGLFSLFFTRVLADRNLLKDIGHPDRERAELPSFGGLVPDASRLNDAFRRLVVPVDQERIDYSYGLTMHAFSFLFTHELGHIMNGHVGLSASERQVFYSELNGFEFAISKDNADCQALEMDADSAAVFQQLAHLFLKIPDRAELDPPYKNETHLNPTHALFFWFFAVHAVFRFFGDMRFTADDLNQMSYPPPRVRQILAISAAVGYVGNSKRPDVAECCKTMGEEALLSVEKAFSVATGLPMSTQGVADALAHTNDHARRISEHWKKSVKPRLAPFTHVPLAN